MSASNVVPFRRSGAAPLTPTTGAPSQIAGAASHPNGRPFLWIVLVPVLWLATVMFIAVFHAWVTR
jgi:hypothetical protein